jgi:Flp pilus assembly protein TadD
MLMRHHNFDAAIVVLESSKKIIARSPQLELSLGVAYYGQRRFSDAVGSFLRTIELDPSIPQPYLYLARIIDQAGDRLPEIERRFAAYASLKPASPLGYYLHARAIFERLPPKGFPEDAAKAEELVRKSLSLKEDEWESHLLLGGLLERKEDFEGARAALERAIALSPGSPAPHLTLARVLLRLGRKEEAVRERNLFKEMTRRQETEIQERAAKIKRLNVTVGPQ